MILGGAVEAAWTDGRRSTPAASSTIPVTVLSHWAIEAARTVGRRAAKLTVAFI